MQTVIETPLNRQDRRRLDKIERKGEQDDRRKFGWRVVEWSEAVGCSRALTYEFLAAKRIESVKLGSARVITTHPQDFLGSLHAK